MKNGVDSKIALNTGSRHLNKSRKKYVPNSVQKVKAQWKQKKLLKYVNLNGISLIDSVKYDLYWKHSLYLH